MLIRKLDPATFVNAYNVDLQLLYPWEGVVEPPFGAAWAVLAPGQATKPHAHQECETFFLARGRGVMSIGEERVEVGAGDVSFHQPFHDHTLTNTGDEDLLFLTVWWEDKSRWSRDDGGQDAHPRPDAEAPAATAAAVPDTDTVTVTETATETANNAVEAPRRDGAPAVGPAVERLLVTAAPPTPNGDLHAGHLAGPYLSADVFTRAQRLRGLDAHFVCGSDDNSIYVEAKASELGATAAETAGRFTDAIEETLAAAGVDLACFPRPNASEHHRPLVRELFRTLYERGELVEKETPAPFCEPCGRTLFESAIRGDCPHCGSGVVGNTCEECGRINDCAELLSPSCTACGATPTARPVRRFVFPLSRWSARLVEYYRRVTMSSHLRSLVEGVLADGPPDVAVTHPCDWGIEVPLAGWQEQRIYVWLEMAARYLAYARHLEDRLGARRGRGAAGWERWWKSPQAAVVQFFGFDNGFYYGMLIPALLMAYDPDIRLPVALVSNEFYRLDGEKFSTSRDHRILGRDLLARVPRDAARFYLAWTCPEREQTSFTREDLGVTLRRELGEGWAAWLASLGRRVAEDFGGCVPATGDWTAEQRGFYHRLEELVAQTARAYSADAFSPQRATRALSELVREARRFGCGERHWDGVATRGEERRTGIALETLAAKVLGLLAAPVMPGFAADLWHALGYRRGPGDGDWQHALDWLPAGQRVDLTRSVLPDLAGDLAG